MLRIGMQAPDFEALTQSGHVFRLQHHLGRQSVVLFFFALHSLWREGEDAGSVDEHLRSMQDRNALLVGVSNGSQRQMQALSEQLKASIVLCSDADLSVCRSYRVLWLRSMGIRRVTYVIDPSGIIRGVAHHELLPERHWTHVDRVLRTITEPS